jgi:hypothetical protein
MGFLKESYCLEEKYRFFENKENDFKEKEVLLTV